MSYSHGSNTLIDGSRNFKYPTSLFADDLDNFNLRSNNNSIYTGTGGTGAIHQAQGGDYCKDYYTCIGLGKTSSYSDSTFISFQYNGTEHGRIYHSTGSTYVYSTTSDYRLKDNVSDLMSQWEKIKALKPCTFTFKNSKDTSAIASGFIAHEISPFYPFSVTGKKDETDEYDRPVYQSMNYASLTTPLIKGMQETIYRVENLQARMSNLFLRIEALETDDI